MYEKKTNSVIRSPHLRWLRVFIFVISILKYVWSGRVARDGDLRSSFYLFFAYYLCVWYFIGAKWSESFVINDRCESRRGTVLYNRISFKVFVWSKWVCFCACALYLPFSFLKFENLYGFLHILKSFVSCFSSQFCMEIIEKYKNNMVKILSLNMENVFHKKQYNHSTIKRFNFITFIT